MAATLSKNYLIILVKYPEKGKVKTRLAKEVGEQKASEIYSVIAKYIIEKFSCPNKYKTSIFYSPPDKKKEIEKWLDLQPLEFYPQIGKTLGEKISNAFEIINSKGARNIIIIGTDCVDITSEDIDATFDSLKDNISQIVIGPATDGGYYLLGMNTFNQDLFSDIDWSTDKVLDQTLERIKKNKLSYTLREELSDIDYMKDINIDALKKLDISMAEKISSVLNSR